MCDLAESYLLEMLEREIHSQRQACITLIAAGATDVELPDLGQAREELFRVLNTLPSDSRDRDLREALGLSA